MARLQQSIDLASGSGFLEAEAGTVRLLHQLWPRFLPYVVIMLVTQAPLILMMIARWCSSGHPFPTWLTNVEQGCIVLSLSHGLANSLLHAWHHGSSSYVSLCRRRYGAVAASEIMVSEVSEGEARGVGVGLSREASVRPRGFKGTC